MMTLKTISSSKLIPRKALGIYICIKVEIK